MRTRMPLPPTQQFALISKSYSDGILLQKDGPVIKKKFNSKCVFNNGRSFRTAATFIPKLVPVNFVTTLTVGEELSYFESISFERRTVMTNFSETMNIFLPKEVTTEYNSNLWYHPDPTTRRYKEGVELVPAKKATLHPQESNDVNEGDATECNEKSEMNGDIVACQEIINGNM